MEDQKRMIRDGLWVEKKEKVQRKKSSQHGTEHLLLKKTTKGLGAPIMLSFTIHTQQQGRFKHKIIIRSSQQLRGINIFLFTHEIFTQKLTTLEVRSCRNPTLKECEDDTHTLEMGT
jgi:hypothetical protein